MEIGQISQPLPLANEAEYVDSREGGLDLGKILGIIRRQAHLIAGITFAVASAAVLKGIIDTPVYQAQFEILTEPVTLETQVISSTNPETLSSDEEVLAVELDEAKLKILKSPRVMAPIITQLELKYSDVSYDSIVDNLSIQISETGNTTNSILEVAYQSADPKEVQDVLALVSEAYLQYSLERRQTDISRGIVFLEAQLPQLRSRVDALQEQLQKLRQQSKLIDPATQAQQLSEQISAFIQQRLETRAQLDEARLLVADLNKELAQQPIELAAASNLASPRYQELLNQLVAIDTQIAQQSVHFFAESSEMSMLREQRQNLLPLLRQEGQRVQRGVDSRIRELQIRDQALTQTINYLNQQIEQLSVTTRSYNELQRELEIATDNLTQFITKREALRIDAAQSEVPWELLTSPSQPQVISASVKKNLVLGAMLGLLLGLGSSLVLEQLSNIIYTTKEIKELTRLPLLGIVPFSKMIQVSAEDLVTLMEPRGTENVKDSLPHQRLAADLIGSSLAVIEAFRSLCSSIRLLNPDTPIRSLVVSSAIPREGKSTVALYLAKAAAALGYRVLLVDADLRSSRLPNQMGPVNFLGLTDRLSRDDLGIHEVIQQTPLEDNLSVLPSGPIPPDPSRLLASERMRNLMKELQTDFDLVIYDAPILTGFADAHLLAASTDGVILVAGLGKVKRSMLEQALEQIKISRTPILGIVSNRAKDAPIQLYSSYGQEHLQASKVA